jgi:hypothetical protein
VTLLLAIIAVVWLMFGNTNPSVETLDIEDTEAPVEEVSDS